ncbi:uncharacterized protein LOC141910945 [Tubulanus polymorphus]|uniref:uncharacterized protein LOC141910945 n=1 Tax=Tubulanus polymorphus TaxID=672921 RepID=UPI003DA5909E
MEEQTENYHNMLHRNRIESCDDIRGLYLEDELWPSYLPCTCGCVYFAVDIGCSLIKVGHLYNRQCTEQQPRQKPCEKCQQTSPSETSVTLVSFVVADLDQCLSYVIRIQSTVKKKLIVTTLGVGTMKHRQKIRETLRVNVSEADEFTCFSSGFHFILSDEELLNQYSTTPPSDEYDGSLIAYPEEDEIDADNAVRFPALLCVAGSTVSFLKVETDGTWNYLHNDSRCGTYFHSLGKLLTGCKSYDELMSLAGAGNSAHLSVCLDEILTEKYATFNANATTATTTTTTTSASTNCHPPQHRHNLCQVKETLPFGRILTDDELVPEREDLARALMNSVVDGLLNVGVLLAREIKTHTVYYVGSFMNQNHIARAYLNLMPQISMHGDWCVRPKFLRHGGYIGVLGALARSLDTRGNHCQVATEIKPD